MEIVTKVGHIPNMIIECAIKLTRHHNYLPKIAVHAHPEIFSTFMQNYEFTASPHVLAYYRGLALYGWPCSPEQTKRHIFVRNLNTGSIMGFKVELEDEE